MAAGHIEKIGEFYMAPGYSTEFLHIYLATDLRPAPLPADDDEFLTVETIPIRQVFAMVEAGQIHDCKTLASLYLARPILIDMIR
jgi:ADP-ribose pyrophosphatase